MELLSVPTDRVATEDAKAACEESGGKVKDHFADVSKMVGIGSGSRLKSDEKRLVHSSAGKGKQKTKPKR